MKIDVCICTHNPRTKILEIVLQGIANQTLSKNDFQVWVIDNGSHPSINRQELSILEVAGVKCHLIVEPQLGIMYARRRAIIETKGDILVFVDDDNELADNYLEIVAEIANSRPEIGCFGGKLLLSSDLNYPLWIEPILPYLAIKDLGDTEITECADKWGVWEPPTAGMAVRREVVAFYLQRLENLPQDLLLGRQGRKGLLSSEDSLIARGTYPLGLSCSYQPRLKLTHHLNPDRFKLFYMVKLGYGYGRSNVLLDRALNIPVLPMSIKDLYGFISSRLQWRWREASSIEHLLCTLAWDLGYIYERQRNLTTHLTIGVANKLALNDSYSAKSK
jgi:glycosyltransferase involved in cell wall biosynthesis